MSNYNVTGRDASARARAINKARDLLSPPHSPAHSDGSRARPWKQITVRARVDMRDDDGDDGEDDDK